MSGGSRAVDGRDARAIRQAVLAARPGYTPQWQPRAGTPDSALLDVFGDHAALLAAGLDQVPARSKLAFLDAIGTELLPAQPARAPVVFVLQADAPVDVSVPADTRVVAEVAPPPPSPLERAPAGKTIVFSTESTFLATRARLASVYSVDPGADRIGDHSAVVETGFSAFDDMVPAEHALYIGHDEILALEGSVDLLVAIELAAKAPVTTWNLSLSWEYWTAAGWMPFQVLDDQTEGLRRHGTIALRRRFGPAATKTTFGGRTSYWVRARVAAPLMREAGQDLGPPPTLDLVQLRVRFQRADVVPEHVFHESSRLDPHADFLPLGHTPEATTSFHIASRDAFERPLARVHLGFQLSKLGGVDGAPQIAWEYHDGTSWQPLSEWELSDETESFTKATGTVTFQRPEEWKEAALHGESSLWMRARLAAGDYGQPMHIEAVDDGSGGFTLEAHPSTLAVPRVSRLTLGYSYVTEPTFADHCLTYNDFAFTDVTEASQWRRRPFVPFTPLSDTLPALYLGFDRALSVGLCSLYLHVAREAEETSIDSDSEFAWEYYSDNGWAELSVLDETSGLRRSGMVQWIGPRDMAVRSVVGGDRFLVRARLERGARSEPRRVDGMWVNAAWASQREVVASDIVGHSDGRPDQTFDLLRRGGAVLDRIGVEVREWSGTGRDWSTAVAEVDQRELRLGRDRANGEVTETWVRWQRVDHLHASEPNDRHFVIERAGGTIAFGDGRRGMIPPVGARVMASYDTGGGVAGNVEAGAIAKVQGVIPFVAEVFNPVAAGGGAEMEAVSLALARGPQRLRHRQRATCEVDYEWLALQASPVVRRARSAGLVGPDGFAQRGWVTLHIVPDGEATEPQPSPELLRRVREGLTRQAPAVVAGRIRLLGPLYLPVGVLVEVVPREPEAAATVEAQVRQMIDRFLHPTRGGVRGDGWRFGEPVYLSWLASRLEGIEGVDHAARLRLRVAGVIQDERVEVPADHVVCAGAHEIQLTLRAR
jgi:hypothetical protein